MHNTLSATKISLANTHVIASDMFVSESEGCTCKVDASLKVIRARAGDSMRTGLGGRLHAVGLRVIVGLCDVSLCFQGYVCWLIYSFICIVLSCAQMRVSLMLR